MLAFGRAARGRRPGGRRRGSRQWASLPLPSAAPLRARLGPARAIAALDLGQLAPEDVFGIRERHGVPDQIWGSAAGRRRSQARTRARNALMTSPSALRTARPRRRRQERRRSSKAPARGEGGGLALVTLRSAHVAQDLGSEQVGSAPLHRETFTEVRRLCALVNRRHAARRRTRDQPGVSAFMRDGGPQLGQLQPKRRSVPTNMPAATRNRPQTSQRQPTTKRKPPVSPNLPRG